MVSVGPSVASEVEGDGLVLSLPGDWTVAGSAALEATADSLTGPAREGAGAVLDLAGVDRMDTVWRREAGRRPVRRRRERRRQPQDRARPHVGPSGPARLPRIRQPGPDRRRPRDRGEGTCRQGVRGRAAVARAGTQAHQGGAILGGFMWNPAEAGRVFVRMGKLLADGQPIADGMTIEGLGVIHPDPKTHNIITDNLLQINKETVDKLAALGL